MQNKNSFGAQSFPQYGIIDLKGKKRDKLPDVELRQEHVVSKDESKSGIIHSKYRRFSVTNDLAMFSRKK